MKKLLLVILIVLGLSSCASLSLNPPVVVRNKPLDGYCYAYIAPTSSVNSVVGYTIGNRYGIFGGTETHTTNPTEIISGYFIKHGFVVLHEINLNSDYSDQILIVNYGQTGIREFGICDYAIEVTIQIVSANNNEILCVGVAEGTGGTDADCIMNAIYKCLDEIFGIKNSKKENLNKEYWQY